MPVAPAARGPSQATVLVDLAAELACYHAPDGEPYADVTVAGHRETHPLRSRAVRAWLARAYHRAHGRAPSSDAVREALGVLEGRALWDGPTQAVALRVGEHAGAVYVDLGDPAWRAIEVAGDGWRIVTDPPVRFRRAPGLLPLPEPVPGGTVDLLRPLVRVTTEDWWQCVGWMLAALRPRGPYPVLALHGEPGAAKSTTARHLRCVVDPSLPALTSPPRDERDLLAAARSAWVVALDNMSRVSEVLSDALCRLATGGGIRVRELYTTCDAVAVDITCPVILTAIPEVCRASDLADRAIAVTLPALDDGARRPEATLRAEYARVQPAVLGALLTAVACGLRDLPTTHLDALPRMADHARWLAACEPALGGDRGTLLGAYLGGRRAAVAAVLDDSAVAGAVRTLAADQRDGWEGTAAELLAVLADRVDDAMRRDRTRWPQSPRGLAGVLRRLGPALRAAGVTIDWLPRDARSRRLRVTTTPDSGATTVTTVTTVTGAADTGAACDGRGPGDGRPSHPTVTEFLSTGAGRDGRDGCDGHGPTTEGDPAAPRCWVCDEPSDYLARDGRCLPGTGCATDAEADA